MIELSSVSEKKSGSHASRLGGSVLRKQINMSQSAWNRVDALREPLKWTRSKIFNYVLEQVIDGKVSMSEFARYRNGHEGGHDIHRTQSGIYFDETKSDFLNDVIRNRFQFSMSHFLEQLFLMRDLEVTLELTPEAIAKKIKLAELQLKQQREDRLAAWKPA